MFPIDYLNMYINRNADRVRADSKNTNWCFLFYKAVFVQLLSQSWWVLIPKIKTKINSSISQIIITNRIILWIPSTFLGVVQKCETNTRALWSWKDFSIYKYNGIPFDAHLCICFTEIKHKTIVWNKTWTWLWPI